MNHSSGAQTISKIVQIACPICRLQGCNRIDRLCRLGEEFSAAKCNFAEENIHQLFSKKFFQHFFDTLARADALSGSESLTYARALPRR